MGFHKNNLHLRCSTKPNYEIMKKSLIALVSLLSLSSVNAQNLAGNKFGDNWSLGVNGGIVSPLTHSSFFKNSRAVIGLDINKQLSPIYGVTFESNWTINTQSPKADFKSSTAFDAFDVMLLHRLNLNNIFAGYNGRPRLFEIEAVGGFGWLRVMDLYPENKDGNFLAAKAGLNFNFNFGKKKDWTIGIKPAILWDMDMRNTGRENTNSTFNANYANWEITAGVTYHFKNSNGEHYMTKVRAYDAEEVSALNATINNLRQETASKDNALKDTQNALRKQEQKSTDLEKALKECQHKAPKVVTNNRNTLESVVTFRQGKTIIDASQQPNVERIAVYLKNHKNAKVSILGYASPEGNIAVNTRIANQRAEAVRTMLINKYKIDASRITAQGLGVGDMFEEPDWNRVSICTIENNK